MTPTGPGTMDDRRKRTGYIMGSRHPMSQSLPPILPAASGEPGATALTGPAEPPGAEGPPNYRDSGTEGASCGDCRHFDAGNCVQFATPVTPNMLCDAHEPAGPPEGMPTGPPPGMEEGGM
jgi:hypothetical protein